MQRPKLRPRLIRPESFLYEKDTTNPVKGTELKSAVWSEAHPTHAAVYRASLDLCHNRPHQLGRVYLRVRHAEALQWPTERKSDYVRQVLPGPMDHCICKFSLRKDAEYLIETD